MTNQKPPFEGRKRGDRCAAGVTPPFHDGRPVTAYRSDGSAPQILEEVALRGLADAWRHYQAERSADFLDGFEAAIVAEHGDGALEEVMARAERIAWEEREPAHA